MKSRTRANNWYTAPETILQFGLSATVMFAHISATADPVMTDAHALAELRKYSVKRELRLSFLSPEDHDTKNYCDGFMRDLKRGVAISAIEPIVKTKILDDPHLREWRECAKTEQMIERSYHYPVLGRSGYRLYKVDADNDQENGLEDVLYIEQDLAASTGPAGFLWWNLSTCEELDTIQTEQNDYRYIGKAKSTGANYSMLIRYKSKTFAMTAAAFPRDLATPSTADWINSTAYYLQITSFKRPEAFQKSAGHECGWSSAQLK
jgi:hypothetical protein